MTTSISDLELLGPPLEDLETRRMRDAAGRALFEDDAPDLMRIGRFQIEQEIGTGGQGAVYLVHDPELDRRVALKRLGGSSPRQVQRMRQEALALAQVSHDNVVKVFEIDEDETGRPFIVMELVDGTTLDAWLVQAPRGWADVLDVFIGIGDGLAAIHAAGLVHRDVKPSNIVITSEGRAKLVDMGIAAVDRAAAPDEAARREGGSSPVGTRGYMAPEQLAGEATARSDQFAFCVALHRAVYGTMPWDPIRGTSQGSAARADAPPSDAKATTEPHDASMTGRGAGGRPPQRLSRVITRGLAREPQQRHPDMPTLVAELRGIRELPSRRARRGLVGLGSAVVLAVVLWPARAPGPCTEDDPSTAMWRDSHRTTVREAFDRSRSGEAAQAFTAVDALFESTARALDDRLELACAEDSTSRGLAVARVQEHQGLLRSFAVSLEQVERSAVEHAPDRLVQALGRLGDGPRDACELGADSTEGASTTGTDAAIEQALTEALRGRTDAAIDIVQRRLAELDSEARAPEQARLHLLHGHLAFEARRLDVARRELQQARSLAERLDCDGLGAEALALWAKAEILDLHPDVDAADQASRQALEKLDGLGDHAGPRRAEALDSRGLVLRKRGQLDEAIASFEQAIAIREQLSPPTLLDIADSMLDLGITQAQRGDTALAIETLERSLRLGEQALWPEHPSLYRMHASLSYRYLERGELEAAERSLARALELAERLGEPSRVAQLHIAMARLLDRRHDFDRALEHAQRADERFVEAHGEDALQRIGALEAMGQVSLDAGWPLRAIPPLERSLEIQAAANSRALDLAIGRGKLAHAHAAAGRNDTALLLYDEARRPFLADPSLRGDPYYPDLELRFGETLLATGRMPEAAEPLRNAVGWWEEHGGNPERLAIARWSLAQASCPAGTGHELARLALTYFESVSTEGARQTRERIEPWLEQPCPRPAPTEPPEPGPTARGAEKPPPL